MDNSIYYPIGVWAFTIYLIWSERKEILNLEDTNQSEKYGCPNCNSEYQSHIKVCADCNNQLAFYIEELKY